MKRIISTACTFLVLQISINTVCQVPSLKPSGLHQVAVDTMKVGESTIVFVDNSAAGPLHRQGYNGIASWQFSADDSSLFVPLFAGFNLEHIFAGDSLSQMYEPRRHPMSLFKKDARTVILYQSPTPLSDVESVTEFTVVSPHYVDVTFRCILHSTEFFKHGYAGFFWASYILHPDDKKIYFRGVKDMKDKPSWIAAYVHEHGVKSTHLSIKDTNNFFFAGNFNATLASHFSDYRFTEPFYYGRTGKMSFAYLFDPNAMIRFSQSPDGGGDANPAWDFQWIIPNPLPKKIYSFKSRLLYKPFVSEDDIREEFNKWKVN